MKRTLKFILEVEIEIDGKIPEDNEITDRLISSLNEGMPSVIFDSDELDCMVCVNSWEYTHEEPRLVSCALDGSTCTLNVNGTERYYTEDLK